MMQGTAWRAPGRVLALSAGLCALAVLIVLWLALDAPQLGFRLRALDDVNSAGLRIESVDPASPARELPVGGTLLALRADNGARVELVAEDIIEESDFLSSYEGIAAFMQRQTQLRQLLEQPVLTAEVRAPNGQLQDYLLQPQLRRLSHLPSSFWIQIFVGAAAFLIGAWVFALRRGEWGARLLALNGCSILLFSFAASVYSSRELAIYGTEHRVLSALNHIGALSFGAAMIALFLMYPRPLLRPRQLLLLPTIFGIWLVADIARWVPDPATGNQLPTLLQMIGILLCIALQWWATRRDPRGRAALRWLGLSVGLGAGAFVAVVIAPVLFGDLPPLPQGIAFVFFLLIHSGVALGVSRYRLFELDEWAFRLLYYSGAVLLLFGVDATLIYALHLDPGASLGLAALAILLGWIPLRERLWGWAVARRRMSEDEMFRSVVDVAFAAQPQEREALWRSLLTRLFDPLELVPDGVPLQEPQLAEDGLELRLPAVAGATALIVRNPWAGRGLFGPAQLALARQLTNFMGWIEQSRSAYDRGAGEERRRIAADLHDDVCARLMTSLHRDGLEETRSTLREVLADIRTVASGLVGERRMLSSVGADLRHETGQRLDAAGIDFEWDHSGLNETRLEYFVYRALVACHREAISNVIRHSKATQVRVHLKRTDKELELSVEDNGVGLSGVGTVRPRGNGLNNLERRARSVGGEAHYESHQTGTRIRIVLPLEARKP